MRYLLPSLCVAIAVAGCSGVMQRSSGYRGFGRPVPQRPDSSGRLVPVPDLGASQPLGPATPLSEGPVLQGPVLEGPVFPEGSRNRRRGASVRSASQSERRPNPIPLSGYYELPPSP